MKFQIRTAAKMPGIMVVYRPDEYSFGVEPDGDPIPNVIQSILLDTLELHVDDDARVVYVDGLCAHTKWVCGNLRPPKASRGLLFAQGLRHQPGVSLQLDSISGWPVVADRQNGWVCIGREATSAALEVVEFAPATIAVLERGDLKAIWLKPSEFPKFP